MGEDEGTFIYHTPCPSCGSSDANAHYSNGTAYCFSCKKWTKGEGDEAPVRPKDKGDVHFLYGDSVPLHMRGIHEDTCKKFNYEVGEHRGEKVQIANYYKDGQRVAQHTRNKNKEFKWIGDAKSVDLFGQHLWRDGGKRLVITEGEIDAMTISQAFGNKWQVVSVPSGASSAKKYLQQQIEWLEKFEEVVLAFDSDPAGIEAIDKCVPLFTAGRVKVASFHPYKDANAMLMAEGSGNIAGCIFEAKVYRPDGILSGNDLTVEALLADDSGVAYSLPYPTMGQRMRGIRKGEITMLTAGSGIGKTTLAREIAYHLMQEHELSIGVVALEESVKKSAMGFMAIDLNVPMGDLFLTPDIVEKEAFEAAHKATVANGRTWYYDHFGSLDSDNLISKLKYLAKGCEVDFIILDHISIAISGIEGGDERRMIDNLMTQLRSLAESSGVGIIAITHLKVPEGKAHEEGGRVTLSQLRGSGAIKQLSDNIIALERDQQGTDADVSHIRILKCRLFGEAVGVADDCRYDQKTGRLLAEETIPPDDFEPVPMGEPKGDF